MKDSQAGAALSVVGVLSPLASRAPLRRLHLTELLKRASRSTPATSTGLAALEKSGDIQKDIQNVKVFQDKYK
jgi:hypothetical protein